MTGITARQRVRCVATTTDFPNLLTVGATLTGNLNNSSGYWRLIAPTPVFANATGIVANTPTASGGPNEYNFYLKITSSTVTGITVNQQVWCAATTTDFPNLLTVGATLTGNLNNSSGYWRFNKAQ